MSRVQTWIVTGAALCVLAFAALFVGVWLLNVEVSRNMERQKQEQRDREPGR